MNALLIWTKQSNVNLSTYSTDIILDERISSATTTYSIIANHVDNNPTIKRSKKIIEPEKV
ncbi:unnamed protein product, partial [Rotaria sp. Silwood2]